MIKIDFRQKSRYTAILSDSPASAWFRKSTSHLFIYWHFIIKYFVSLIDTILNSNCPQNSFLIYNRCFLPDRFLSFSKLLLHSVVLVLLQFPSILWLAS